MRAFTVRYRVGETEERREIRVFGLDKLDALETFERRYPQHCAVGISEEGRIEA